MLQLPLSHSDNFTKNNQKEISSIGKSHYISNFSFELEMTILVSLSRRMSVNKKRYFGACFVVERQIKGKKYVVRTMRLSVETIIRNIKAKNSNNMTTTIIDSSQKSSIHGFGCKINFVISD